MSAKHSIARSTAVMSVSTAVSRVTGFLRAWATAYALGVTVVSASYTVANNVPNMIYELVAGGVLSSLFIPVFIERRQREGEDAAWRFASDVFNVALIVLGLVALAGTVWAPAFIRTQTFRIDPEEASLAVYLFRFFAVQVVFYGAAAVFTGVLNSYRRFLAPAVAPIFNNLVVIGTLLGFYVPTYRHDPQLALSGLAVGTTLGVAVMALVQIPSLIALRPKYTLKLDLRDPGIRSIGRLMGPTVVYVLASMVGVSFRNAYALQVSRSGTATLSYAWMFYQLPYGIFAVALATAIFPELAAHAGAKDWERFAGIFGKGLRVTALLVLPMAAMLVALATPVVTLYRFGNFTAADVAPVASVLTWWALGLFFYATYMFVLRSFYSLQDTRTPAVVNVVGTLLHVALYAVLTAGLAGWSGLGLRGIPLADALFFTMQAAVLLVLLKRRVPALALRRTASTIVRVALAAVVGGGAAWGVARLAGETLTGRAVFVAQIVLGGGVGLALTYVLAALFGVGEVSGAVTGLRRRLARRRERS